MMVNGCHQEDPFPSRFERHDLEDDRNRLDHEDAAHQEQQQLVFADHRDGPQRRAQRQGAHIAHEHGGRIGVEPEESEAGPEDGRGEHREFSRPFDIRDQQILGRNPVSDHVGHDGVRQCGDHHGAHRQAIEAVRQVDRVRTPDDHQDREWDVEQTEIRREILEKGHAQFG